MIRKLTEDQVHEICKLMEDGLGNTEIAKKYDISHSGVSKIRCGISHEHISKLYNFERLVDKKLTEEQVHEICKLMEEGVSNIEIAKKYDIGPRTVSAIRCSRLHTHISKNYNLEKLILTDEQVHDICKLMEDGVSNKEISKRYNINHSTVSQIHCGKSYKHISENYNIKSNDSNDPTDIEVVHKICKLLEDGYRNVDISIECDVEQMVVCSIRNGLSHRDISKNYKIQRKFRKRKLGDEVIHEICRLLEEGYSYKDINRLTNVSHSTITLIKNSDRYRDISSQYDFNKNKKNTHK